MIERLIRWCTSNRVVVLLASLALAGWGGWAARHTPLDAVPDTSEVQVIVATEWRGRSADLIEDQITYPIVTTLISTPHVKSVRGVTDFGMSSVYVIFEDGTDMYWARSRVVEFLSGVKSRLPDGVEPAIGPDATGVGWVFEYALVDTSGRQTLSDLRGLQDWHMRYWLSSVPGVAEVASIGGYVKQYQVSLDPDRLARYDVSLKEVVEAIRASNNEVAGGLLEFSGREYVVRGRGYIGSLQDIEQVSIPSAGGTPVLVGDVANVRLGPDLRRGVAELNGEGEVVGGIVVMRFGENALATIDRVKAKLKEVQRSLPAGVTIVPTYDRSGLIRDSIGTLRTTLIEEAIVVSLVVIVFLCHVRSALITILALPVAVLASFIPMYYFGVTSNIMSLGGIALAIGELVDASIVMVENAFRRVSEEGTASADHAWRTAISATTQLGRPIFFSLAIVIISFAPVFLLEAQEGRMFRPLALTKTLAMAAASLLSLTLVPVLITLLVRGRRLRPEAANPVARSCARVYAPVLAFALRWRWAALALNFAVIPATLPLVFLLGSEFMPPLYEGSLLYMPTAPPGLSITEVTRLLQVQDKVLRRFPEVERVFGTAGRATTATDNSPMGMVNTTVLLKPRSQWRPGLTFESLQAEMDDALQVPGFPNTWTQPIRNRLDMLSTGIKTPVGIKIMGPDLGVIERIGGELEAALRQVPSTRGVYAERVTQGYYTDIRINRPALARYGLTIDEVQETIETAIGGENVSRTIEGRERYPVNVRYDRAYRDDLPAIGRVLIKTPAGAQVPLGELADIGLTPGPSMIRDDDGQLAGYVYIDPSTSDLGGYVDRARQAIQAQVSLPEGYTMAWTGQYEFQVRARARLRIIVPIVMGLIACLLYLTFRSWSEAVIVMLSVPYAMTGGVIAQWLLGYNFSVAVWVGYIALYGVAVQTGVVMVVYLHEALDERLRRGPVTDRDIWEATVAGSVLRLRPKLMTVAATTLSLLPIMWSSGIGADVMKPIAAPIIGGMVTSAIHVLIVTPLIFLIMKRRALRRGTLRPSGMAGEALAAST